MSKKKKPNQLVKSLDRALDILEHLVDNQEGMGVTEISKSLGLHKSTVYRLLATLNYRGYVTKESVTDRYKTGLKLLEVGSAVLEGLDLRTQVKPYIKKLRDETSETAHLGVLDDLEVVYIDKEETSEEIRMYSRLGRKVEPHCTSLGKVLLAYSPEELVDRFIEERGLKRYTENTITEAEQLKQHLEEVRKQGYALDDEEQKLGIRCIGGPIFDHSGEIIAAFSIAGPTSRLGKDRLEEIAGTIIDYSDKISASLGYNGEI